MVIGQILVIVLVCGLQLVEFFCAFRVEFFRLCSMNFGVLLLKFPVPGLSNSFPWNFFCLSTKLCSGPWPSHLGAKLTPIHNYVPFSRLMKRRRFLRRFCRLKLRHGTHIMRDRGHFENFDFLATLHQKKHCHCDNNMYYSTCTKFEFIWT